MNTPAHLIFGAAALSSPKARGSFTAAIFGGLAPDLSLYLLAGVSLFVLGIPADTVFREYYYSEAWQQVFAIDNSFVLWGLLLAVSLWRSWRLVAVFAGSALLHIALDFPLHTHDARMHFWPVSDWVFYSPYSYWDTSAGARIFGPLEAGLSIILAGVLVVRFKSWIIRGCVLLLLMLELLSSGVWQFIF